MQRHEFSTGVLWDNNPFVIETDHAYETDDHSQPCPHCHSPSPVPGWPRYTAWICPAVVIVENEGGYNSTGVCLACVQEAAELLKARGVTQIRDAVFG